MRSGSRFGSYEGSIRRGFECAMVLWLSACGWPVLAPGFARADAGDVVNVDAGGLDAIDADTGISDVTVLADETDSPPEMPICDEDAGLICDDVCVGNLDPRNCGNCGNVCGDVPGGFPACVKGRCAFGACLDRFADCDLDERNGCEAVLHTDQRCSTCTDRCAAGTNCVDTMRVGFACCTQATGCACGSLRSCERGPGGTTLCCDAPVM